LAAVGVLGMDDVRYATEVERSLTVLGSGW